MKYLLQLFILFLVFGILVTCEKDNNPPEIQITTASPQTLKTGETSQLNCVATDPDGNQLTYSWSSSNGIFSNGTSGSSVSWKAPDEPGVNSISVFVNDGQNVADGSVNVTVEANPLLSVSPTELDFGTEETEKTIEIKNTGSGVLSWTASKDVNWLTLGTQSGEVTTETDKITVTANREDLTAGSNSGTLTISSNSGNQNITVTIEVPEEPILSVSPTNLEFGTSTNQLSFEITNSGSGTLTWSISEKLSWLSLDKISGSTTTETDKVNVTDDRSGLDPGSYDGTIAITSNDGNQNIAVTIEVSELFGEFRDSRDWVIYNWVAIGNQIWMAENLAYLPKVSSPSGDSYIGPYYYVYGYSGTDVSAAKATDNYETYGVLYNWPAALTACPAGWHLPTDDEWKQLEMAIGMSQSEADDSGWRGTNEGTKLKTTSGWDNNGDGTDDFGFSGLPGGYRDTNGNFNSIGTNGYWWSSTETSTYYAWFRSLYYSYPRFYRSNYDKAYGFSVRCVRD